MERESLVEEVEKCQAEIKNYRDLSNKYTDFTEKDLRKRGLNSSDRSHSIHHFEEMAHYAEGFLAKAKENLEHFDAPSLDW